MAPAGTRGAKASCSLTWVAVGEQGADGEQHLGDGERRTPVVLQDVQTDHPLTVDVAVIDPCAKSYLFSHTHTHRHTHVQLIKIPPKEITRVI